MCRLLKTPGSGRSLGLSVCTPNPREKWHFQTSLIWRRLTWAAHLKCVCGVSLVGQWQRSLLPMQETGVWSLLWEGPTCPWAAEPVHRNYRGCALIPGNWSCWAHMLQLPKPAHLKPVLWNKRNHLREKPMNHNQRVASTHHSWRKTECSNEDPVQPKKPN